jgi:hypothetical protein
VGRVTKGGFEVVSRRWTLLFGGEVEVSAMTATAMSSRWLQRKRAVDSAMRVATTMTARRRWWR